MTDREWLSLRHSSAKEAQLSLITEYGSLVYVIVLNRLRGSADHEAIRDCVSDVFLEVFRSIDRFDPEKGSLKNFISAVARNISLNAFDRISTRRSRFVSIDDEETVLPAAPENTEDDVLDRVSGEHLWQIVKSLGKPDSTILVYQYFYELTVPKIAEKLSMSPEAVRKRSQRARKRIRKIIEAERGVLDE